MPKSYKIIVFILIVLFAGICFFGGMIYATDKATEKIDSILNETTYFSVDPNQMEAEGYSVFIDGTLYIDLERGLYLFSAK